MKFHTEEYKQLDAALGDTETMLRGAESKSAPFLRPHINQALANLALLTVPNIRDNKISLSKQQIADGKIPIIIAKPGKAVKATRKLRQPHQRQKEIIENINISGQSAFTNDVMRAFKEDNVPYNATRDSSSVASTQAARCIAKVFLYTSSRHFLADVSVHSCPIMFIRKQRNSMSPYSIAHELVHVEQDLSSPVRVMQDLNKHGKRQSLKEGRHEWNALQEMGAYALEDILLNLGSEATRKSKHLSHNLNLKDFTMLGKNQPASVWELSEVAKVLARANSLFPLTLKSSIVFSDPMMRKWNAADWGESKQETVQSIADLFERVDNAAQTKSEPATFSNAD
jgi:hypothetical protein